MIAIRVTALPQKMAQCVLDFFHGELECSLSAAANECNDTLVSRAKELKDPKVKPVFRSRLA